MHAATEQAIAEIQKYDEFEQKLKDAQGDAKEALLDDDDAMDMLAFGLARVFRKYVVELAKARLLTITGDTTHMSVRSKIELMENIDKPRKYDFQKEDVNEQAVISMLEHYGLPEYDMRLADRTKLTTERAIAVLKGEEAITVSLGYNGTCYDCGDKMLVTINGTNLHYTAVNGACKSNAIFDIEIDFPTGEIVFGDWPDRFSEIAAAGMLPTKSFDINTMMGCRQSTEAYMPYQVFHHFVGNTSPTWYYNKDTKQIQIGTTYIEGTEENDWEDEYLAPEGSDEKGSFCTDLWWVTMLDKQYYDEMLALLPGKRDNSFYEKDVETATVEPGRYRFTAYSRSEDDSVNAIAVRIGDCSGVPPKRDNMAGRRIMTPMEKVVMDVWKYNKKQITEAWAQVRVESTLDHLFNVIGNGIRSKAEFLDYVSIGEDEEVPKFADPDGKVYSTTHSYYPNFQKQYSTIYQMDVADIPTVWLEAAEGFYTRALSYFESGAEGYYHAFPNDKDDLHEVIERVREGRTESEWHKYVSETYGWAKCEFTGDYEDWRIRCWAKEKAGVIDFITETIAYIKAELDKRD